MRTAIVSDLHLGSVFGEDVARGPRIRSLMLEELSGADRVVLLGDAVELRQRPLGTALAATRPFFEHLGEALAGREVVIVPGNHDHRFAEPLLDELSLAGGTALGLEHRFDPSPGPAAQLAEWLGDARLQLAYPGIWLREDIYATHGHYLDCHLTLPRAECIAAAVVMRRSGPLPDPAEPGDYERVLRPIYGLAFGRAQSRRATQIAEAIERPSEAAWKLVAGRNDGSLSQRLLGSAARAGVPAAIWAINRALDARFDSDLSPAGIQRGNLAAAAELSARLRIAAAHLIIGHTHRGGPHGGEPPWALPGGGELHNTGSWVFASVFHHPGRPPGPYWPGTVTWVEDGGAPRRVELLADHSHEELTESVAQALSRQS